MAKTIFINYKINGELQNAYSVVLTDSTGTYGIRETSSSIVIVQPNTEVENPSTGVYQYQFTQVQNNIQYDVAWKIIEAEGFAPYYVTQKIGPFTDSGSVVTDSGFRAVADEKGTFIIGTIGSLLLRITTFDGTPIDPEEISLTITYPPANTVVLTATPEKADTGFYVYEWNIPTDQSTGKYNVTWNFTVNAQDSTELQTVVVAADGQDVQVYSGRAADMKSILEQYIYCAQNIPVYFEQSKESVDNQTYRFTFPRWNQAPGVRVYRNKKQILTGGAEINYFNGTITFDTPLTSSDKIYVDYNFRWFSDEELYDFIQMAIRALNVYPPGTYYTIDNLPYNWTPAVIYHASVDAIRRILMCLNFQEPRQVFGGDDQLSTMFGNFDTLKKNYEEEVKTLFEQKKLGPYPTIGLSVVPEYTLPGGRSLVPETTIFVEIDNIIRTCTIKEAYDLFHSGENLKVQSQDEKGELVFAKVEYIFTSGEKEIYTLITEKGLSIDSSKEHLFYANEQYLPLEQITIGDSLVICQNEELSEDKVKQIIKTNKTVEMYDMDVPSTQNLFANGIKCHNSRWFRMLFSTNS